VVSGTQGVPRGYETIASAVEHDRLQRSRARFFGGSRGRSRRLEPVHQAV
jgi:hypothetical protein